MDTMLNGTMGAAKNAMGSARHSAGQAFDSVKGSAEQALGSAKEATSGARSTLMDGLRTLSTLVATVRSLDGDDALGWIGLARRRGPAVSMAIFGAGMVTGAGIALLFAPMSGEETRRRILGLFQSMKPGPTASADRPRTDLEEPSDDAMPATDPRPDPAPARAYGADGRTHH